MNRGGDVPLATGDGSSLAAFPFLSRYVGQHLVVTDGTTLLGADDKAGVAEILAACAYLTEHPDIPHGRIAVGFTPDEEIGCGADHFDVKRFGADAAYTVDGGELGEIEFENFNAASATVEVQGVNIHPGSAKNRMKNAVLMLCEWLNGLPAAETPAHTEGYEGFYHVHGMEGNETHARADLLIRDHDRTSFEARKAFLSRLTAYEREGGDARGRRGAGYGPHPGRNGRRTAFLYGLALPEPLHRRRELPRRSRVHPGRIDGKNGGGAGGTDEAPGRGVNRMPENG